jgi:hypothetical protein
MAVSQGLAGLFYYLQMPVALYACIVVFCAFFSLSQGPVSWLYFSEVMVDQGMGFVVLGLWASCIE